jgi:hypothetical protein
MHPLAIIVTAGLFISIVAVLGVLIHRDRKAIRAALRGEWNPNQPDPHLEAEARRLFRELERERIIRERFDLESG